MPALNNLTTDREVPGPSVESPIVSLSPNRKRGSASAMNWVAVRMLTGDRAKYLGLIFAIAFSTFLIAQQSSLFVVVINRTRSFIVDVTDANIWVMAPATRYIDEVYALKDDDVERVRSVPGVSWAVPFYKGSARVLAPDGNFREATLLGVDDASLAGAPEPRRMVLGSIENLREPDAVVIDLAGYNFFFPGEPLTLGKTFEMNDHRAKVVGIVSASVPFGPLPLFYTRYSLALDFVGRERKLLSFVLAKGAPGARLSDVTKRIGDQTGLQALSSDEFGWMTIWYYIHNTAFTTVFGITVVVAIIIGTVVAGQTFYMFTLENLKQFAALKAIGTTNGRIVRMIVLQALLVGALGYSIGIGMTTLAFVGMAHKQPTRDSMLFWQTMGLAAGLELLIVLIASLASIRKIVVLEPAVVFRG
jgi:putative ABC transport system permease protein